MNDHSHGSLYGGRRWVAATLGMSPSTFDKKRSALEDQGFPLRDRLLDRWIKADVLAWVSRRRQIADKIDAPQNQQEEAQINEDEL